MMKSRCLSFTLAKSGRSLLCDVAPCTTLDDGTGVRIIAQHELSRTLRVSPNSTFRF